ncbi:sigma-70 family RNA polymerase sigma factor [Streptomyces calidiresistens]|uniref:Sigma-70 family RNA polymerase sigma factor n=1 Tax=Streptomyces calidiresistens TaxID=1485586 RepID=A0A7W3T7A8_9ACTN|nr:sigma-70 family RNA polymerase sigma factor [Streptomyces calidiresistens]MBB0232263.1 sigma-70 family RNA polymerase sigma factor [Streptomyces calidiresistens]
MCPSPAPSRSAPACSGARRNPSPATREPHGRRLATLLLRHRERLLRHVVRLTGGDPHRAEDIVQETLLRAWVFLELTDDTDPAEEERLVAWLHRVARNLVIDTHRRDRAVPVGVVPDELMPPAGGSDVAEAVVDRQVVRHALARLSPAHREVLVEVHLRDRTGAEAARAIGIPPGTVKSRTHYALVALRRELTRSSTNGESAAA